MAASPTFNHETLFIPWLKYSRDRSNKNIIHVRLPHGVDFLLTGYLLVLWKQKSSRDTIKGKVENVFML